jgi:beta-galactosidase GanA
MILIRASLPVPSLWLDIFQKIKALGYNGVSFYAAWVLHEPKPGSFSAEGIFDWEPYFDAAKKSGVYLVAVSMKDKSSTLADQAATWSIYQC